MRKIFALVILMFACSGLSLAWNCTGNNIRVQVPTGTKGTGTGDAPGNVVVDNGLTFECEAPPTTPTDPSSPTSSSSSTSTSGASSTATGGNATSKSGVSNSGNSTNTLSNTQGQTQSNSSTNNNASAATGNGDNSDNSTTNIKPAAASVYAPVGFSTAPCLASFGAGAQSVPGGISFGGSRVDKGCDDRQTAIQFALLLNNRLAAAKILCTTKAAKRAKLTLDDCMAFAAPAPAPVAVVAPVVSTPVPVQVTVNTPQPQVTILPVLHDEITVTATRSQVRAAQITKPVVKKRTAKPCVVPSSLQQPMEK